MIAGMHRMSEVSHHIIYFCSFTGMYMDEYIMEVARVNFRKYVNLKNVDFGGTFNKNFECFPLNCVH